MNALLKWLVVFGMAVSSTYGQQPPSALLLAGARVLDPAGETYLENRDVLIVNDRIKEISPAGQANPPKGTPRLDLSGLTILPGLIDLHTHLLLRPYDQMSWDDQVLKEWLELRTIRAVAAARATLEAGFTTLRDLGTEGAGYADVALRDAVTAGIIPGPRIYASTRAIVATGCYGPMGFDPRWDVPKGGQVADGADGIRRVVREQIAAGADWVKVYADYRRRPGDLATPTFSQEELNALVAEAHSAGRPVAAHASTDEGIRRAVVAGVNTIEHGTGASEETLAMMRDRKVAMCPTLAASEAMARYEGWRPDQPVPRGTDAFRCTSVPLVPRRDRESEAPAEPRRDRREGDPPGRTAEPPLRREGEAPAEPPLPPRLRDVRDMFDRALRSGVTIACGSDAGVFAHGENAREIELMVAYGMSPPQALRAATSTAARVLNRDNDLGRVAPGYVADLIAVRGDPLKDPSALRDPLLVIKEGKIVLDRRNAAPKP